MAQTIDTAFPGLSCIMVHLDLGPDVGRRVEIAASLAGRFGAKLVGVGAEQPFTSTFGDESVPIIDTIADEEERRVAADLGKAEALFRSIAARSGLGKGDFEWRSAATATTRFLLEQSCIADLVVVGRQGGDDERDWRLGMSTGDVLMELGRPMLMVPPAITDFSARSIVVAWSNWRESRWAIADALPFLRKAEAVLLVTVGRRPGETESDDLATYLRGHGVAGFRFLHVSEHTTVVPQLLQVADEEGSDLIVAGGYGHSRMREWALGGTTSDLLESSPACCLLSH